MTPSASVILVTRDRQEDLRLALDSLRGQGAAEVIVVDDGSRDGTAELLRARPDVVAITRERSFGPGLARNAAAERATGDVLVFLDSDCRAQPGWLAALVEPLAKESVGAVGGAEELPPDEPLLGRVFHFVLTSRLTTGGLRGAAGRKVARYRPRTYSLAVRREAFARAGGFCGLRNGEDIDFGHRLARLGYELVYAPAARVYHRRRTTFAGFLRQLFAMGRARATLIRRDRAHLEPAYLLPLVLVLALPLLALRPPLLILPLVHALLVGATAARKLRTPAALALAPAAFAVQQAAYAAGLCYGALRPFREERP